MKPGKKILAVVVLSLWFPEIRLFAESIQIAVASNFAEPANIISKDFEKEFKTKVLVSVGSSGRLYAQIKNGAPWSVFLCADNVYTQKLIDEKFADEKTRKIYALGKLALWSWKNNLKIDETSVFDPSNKILSIASSRLAPYGQASEEVLKKINFNKQKFHGKIVYGENISQAMNYVKTKNADIGFVSKSLINALPDDEKGSYWEVPASLHNPIKQEIVLLNNNSGSKLAEKYIDFLDKESSRKIISEFGYDLPARSK